MVKMYGKSLLLVCLIVFLICALPVWSNGQGGTSSILERLLNLENENNALKGRLSTLEGKVSTLEGKVSTLEGKVSTLEQNIIAIQNGNFQFKKIQVEGLHALNNDGFKFYFTNAKHNYPMGISFYYLTADLQGKTRQYTVVGEPTGFVCFQPPHVDGNQGFSFQDDNSDNCCSLNWLGKETIIHRNLPTNK